MHLPSAENRYPDFPGLPVAERAVFRFAACPNPHSLEETQAALDSYLAGEPHGDLANRPVDTHDEHVTFAQVRQGRWLVPCPWCLRNGKATHYQFAARTDPRFFCTECHNAQADGHFIAVEWPDETDQIEQLLAKRLDPVQRNWLPGETVEDLAVENLQPGVTG